MSKKSISDMPFRYSTSSRTMKSALSIYNVSLICPQSDKSLIIVVVCSKVLLCSEYEMGMGIARTRENGFMLTSHRSQIVPNISKSDYSVKG